MSKLILIFLTQILFTTSAQATNLELELSQGSQTKSQELSADGRYNSSDENSDKKNKNTPEENIYRWDLSYTHSTTEVKQQAQDVITDNSHSVTVGSGIETPGKFSFNADLDYSKTPEEYLQSFGPTLTFGYTYEFKRKKTRRKKKPVSEDDDDDSEEEFRPSIGTELALGYDNYVQTFTKGARRKNGGVARPTNGTNEINKKSAELSLKTSPWSWLSAKLSYAKYSFNKDVSQFLQYLDVRAVGRPSAGMEDALAGFYDHILTVDLYFYFFEDWELNIEHSVSNVIVDNSTATYDKFMIYDEVTDSWRLGFGVEYSKSNASTAVDTSDRIFNLSLTYMY